jgi:hypothetical protein
MGWISVMLLHTQQLPHLGQPRTCSMPLHQLQITLLLLRIVMLIKCTHTTRNFTLGHIFSPKVSSHVTSSLRVGAMTFICLPGRMNSEGRSAIIGTSGKMRNNRVILRTGAAFNVGKKTVSLIWPLRPFTADATLHGIPVKMRDEVNKVAQAEGLLPLPNLVLHPVSFRITVIVFSKNKIAVVLLFVTITAWKVVLASIHYTNGVKCYRCCLSCFFADNLGWMHIYWNSAVFS